VGPLLLVEGDGEAYDQVGRVSMGEVSRRCVAGRRRRRWQGLAAGYGRALALVVGHGTHLRPTCRGELWSGL
jgi:hypothetical protein